MAAAASTLYLYKQMEIWTLKPPSDSMMTLPSWQGFGEVFRCIRNTVSMKGQQDM